SRWETSDNKNLLGGCQPNGMVAGAYMKSTGSHGHPGGSGPQPTGVEIQPALMATGPRPARPAEVEEIPEDRELLLRLQGGDGGAFDALVRRYLPRARLIARRLMQDPDDADDLVQDAFLR